MYAISVVIVADVNCKVWYGKDFSISAFRHHQIQIPKLPALTISYLQPSAYILNATHLSPLPQYLCRS